MIYFPAPDLPRSALLVSKTLPQSRAIVGHIFGVEF